MKRFALVMLAAALILMTACSTSTNHETKHGTNHGTNHGEGGSKTGNAGHEAGGEHANAGAEVHTEAAWKLSEEQVQPNSDTTIDVQINDDNGKPVDNFDISHEKQMHLIVVSKDLSFFNHIHPEYKGNGRFEVKTRFPAAGEYKLIADYVPTGGSATNKSTWITVKGTAPDMKPIKPDQELVKSVDGVEATLAYEHLVAGTDLNLTFRMVDSKSKKPVTDLEPYLGAVGHVVIMSADAGEYLHVHPSDDKSKGPDAKFMTNFPQSGVYKVWGQFQRNGKTFIVPFVIDVP
ncbi:hypothetical protein KZ483_12445 [Paenibacillus sp. sptzw28]|uniref:hypothetical protein n=1 Tax=Paenibacillus sp. sptzw28 TaxID=715179 RepID=UPI001C6E2E6F|nr:hypothetical protein [Paenibacillus sp. sptzw28]QYR23629.1 hypothetical protein KZ483_12445 [Paenibacillus sp. sptzw28]